MSNVLGNIGHRVRGTFNSKAVPTFHDFESVVPYEDICDRYIVDKFGCVHLIFEVDAPAADVASAGRLVGIQTQLVNLIERLPEFVGQIQFIYTTNGDYREAIVAHGKFASDWPIANYLRQERTRVLLEETSQRKLIRSSTLMVLSCLPRSDSSKKADGKGSSLEELKRGGASRLKRRAITRTQFEEAVNSLLIAESVAKDSLARVGIKIKAQSAEQIADYLYKLFNQEWAWDLGLPVNYDYDITPINDAWICQDVEVLADNIKIGNYYHAFVSMNGKPQESSPRIVEVLTSGLGFSDVRCTLSIRRLDKNAEMEKLRKMRKNSIGRMKEPMNILDRIINPKKEESPVLYQMNVEANDEVTEANELISDLRSGAEYLAQVQLVVHFWASDTQELKRRRELIVSQMANMNRARPYAERASTLRVFESSLPASMEPFQRGLKVRGKMAADLVPLHRGFEGGGDPVCMLRNSTGGLVSLDLFSGSTTDATMAFVAGGSGSGKSFLINQLLLQHMIGSPLVIIMDVGGSYAPLVKLMGGQVIEFNEDRPFTFNPLQIYSQTSTAVREPDLAARSRMVRSIEAMVTVESDPGGMLDDGLVTKIDRAVETAFTQARTHGRPFITTYDLLRLFTEYPDAQVLADRIKPFTRGQIFGQWFDGPTSIDLRTQVVCFDLKGIRKIKRLTRSMVPLLINYIQDMVMSNKSQRKLIVMDELWEAILSENLMNFVVEAWKTFRKENSAVIGCSQNLATDIAANPVVKGAIIQNTETYFLLNQGPADENRVVADLLNLTDGQVDLLNNLQRSNKVDRDGRVHNWREVFVMRGRGDRAQSGKARIEPTSAEYWMSTTYPPEMIERERTMHQYDGDLSRAIQHLAKTHPAGLRAEKAP